MAQDLSVTAITITLAVPNLVALTVLQGFAPDDIYAINDVDTGETMMGLDGILSGGYVPVARTIVFKQMANSPTESFFDAWGQGEDLAMVKYPAYGTITYPGLQKVAIMTNGFLRARKFLPDAQKLLMPQTFAVEWQKVQVTGL